ncbi:hypothetical protein L1049_012689 [Liquidambar formosana]|uniref:Uncharacterized protein n=1 Tax=Liquidambar formosana TaxID=63359 RepID=A0AAP0RJ45_LIQFO
MLQWMGGSRRKVTTSRRSTQKRQKQYFEQRKRQQQQQQTSGLESYADGMNICDKHHKEHRSLDILSLLNLSTIAQACKSTCPDGKEDSKVNASTVNCHVGKYPPTVLIHTITAADTVEVKETRIPSGCQEETVSPKKVLFSAPDSNDNPFNGDGDKVDYWETTDHPLSVLDLLGDDGQNGHTEGNPVHEAHVSFSVEGLGKVGTETPVHSPQQPSWLSSYGCSPLKAAKRLHSSKNLHYVHDDLEFEVDAMMQDINMPHGDSSTELPSYSRGIMNSVCNPTPKLSPFEDCTQLYGHSSKIQNSFGDGKIFIDIEDDENNICKAGSSFLDDNFFGKREYGTSWKNWPSQMEGNSMDLFKFGNHEMLNFDFEGPYPLKKRFTKKPTDGFKGLGAFCPHRTIKLLFLFTSL